MWQPIASAPKDGTPFIGLLTDWRDNPDDVKRLFWHEKFGEFISGFRRMTLAAGLTFEDGTSVQDHSPEIYKPVAWMPLPEPPVA